MIEQKFVVGIKKVSTDGNAWEVTVGSKSEGVPIEEAVFYIEGWVKKVKKELQERHFANLQFKKED